MRKRMTEAAQLDAINRQEGKPAMHKLKMLPEVVSLLNRNQYVNSLVDPEINILEAVKFFLEPLDDGSLPAYNIQRDLMVSLGRLPINKETLIASGIGKVIVFYTKSKRPETAIKRMAERLLAEWTRPILQRSDDYSKRVYQEVAFDPRFVQASRLFFLSAFILEEHADRYKTTANSYIPGVSRSDSSGSEGKRTPPTSTGKPGASGNNSSQLHSGASTDVDTRKQVCTPSWSQWGGSISSYAGKADCIVEGSAEIIMPFNQELWWQAGEGAGGTRSRTGDCF